MTDRQWQLLAKYICNEATESEKEEVVAWIALNNENKLFSEKLIRYWKRDSASLPDFKQFNQHDWQLLSQHIHQPKVRPFYNTSVFRMAASIAFVCSFIGVFLLLRSHLEKPAMVYRSSNAIREIWLPDSSLVVLNKNSMLITDGDYGDENREVTLEGEAFFEVKRNEQLAFEVTSYELTTTVLGTAFNINANSPDNINVSVVHGKVRVSATGSSAVLNKSMAINYLKGSGLGKPLETDLNFLSWKTGIIRFDNQDLQAVVTVLSKHYGKKIMLSEKVLGSTRITIELNQKDVHEALKLIALTLDLEVKPQMDGYLLSIPSK
jgi:transmembrane sensor